MASVDPERAIRRTEFDMMMRSELDKLDQMNRVIPCILLYKPPYGDMYWLCSKSSMSTKYAKQWLEFQFREKGNKTCSREPDVKLIPANWPVPLPDRVMTYFSVPKDSVFD
jgi:hypothetical protein